MGGPALRVRPAARVKTISRKPANRPARKIAAGTLKKMRERTAVKKLKEKITEFSKYNGNIPESKKMELKTVQRGIEERYKYLQASIELASGKLNRQRFSQDRVSFLSKLRQQEIRRPGITEHKLSDYAIQKLKAGYKATELLKAGYTKREVTNALFSLEINK